MTTNPWRTLLPVFLTAASLVCLATVFAAPKKPPTPEEVCTSVQISTYAGCHNAGGSEDHCWMYARQKYKDCMDEYALNKRLKEEGRGTSGSSGRPTVKPPISPPFTKKGADDGRAQQPLVIDRAPSPSPTVKKSTPSPRRTN